MNKLSFSLLLISSILLIGCGGGGGNTSAGIDTDSDSDKKELPFSLEKSDGSIAGEIGLYVFGAYALPANRISIESANIPASGTDPNNLNAYDEFRKPICTGGDIDYSDDKPNAPLHISDISLLKNINVHISATNCHLKKTDYFDSDFLTGSISWSRKYDNNEITLESNYDKFTQVSNNTYEEIGNDFVNITGSSYLRNNNIEGDDGEVVSRLNDEYSSNTIGFNMRLHNFDYRAIKNSGILSVNNFSYNVRWNMLNPSHGTHYLEDNLAKVVIGLGFREIFPEGNYDLNLRVTSPIIYKPEGNGLLFASGGAITVDLASHNIQADIHYSENGATITYVRNGNTKTVEINNLGQVR